MERNKRRRITPICCAALTLCFSSVAAAGEGPALFDESGANAVVPLEYLPPLLSLAEKGKQCASDEPLETALRDALYEENGALRTALDACGGAAASADVEMDYARRQISLDERSITAWEGARETDRALRDEMENENRGLRLTLAGIKWIFYAVSAAAQSTLARHRGALRKKRPGTVPRPFF